MTEYAKQKRYRDKLKAKAKAYDELEPQLASLKSEYALVCASQDATEAMLTKAHDGLRQLVQALSDSKTDKGKRLHSIAMEALAPLRSGKQGEE